MPIRRRKVTVTLPPRDSQGRTSMKLSTLYCSRSSFSLNKSLITLTFWNNPQSSGQNLRFQFQENGREMRTKEDETGMHGRPTTVDWLGLQRGE